VLCQKTEQDFWEATYRELDIALEAATKFEQEHTLPLLAVHATWVAVQMKQEKKLLDIDKLMGKKELGGTMSRSEMLTEVGKLADFHAQHKAKLKKKKEAEELA